jgi:hypothetical protein
MPSTSSSACKAFALVLKKEDTLFYVVTKSCATPRNARHAAIGCWCWWAEGPETYRAKQRLHPRPCNKHQRRMNVADARGQHLDTAGFRVGVPSLRNLLPHGVPALQLLPAKGALLAALCCINRLHFLLVLLQAPARLGTAGVRLWVAGMSTSCCRTGNNFSRHWRVLLCSAVSCPFDCASLMCFCWLTSSRCKLLNLLMMLEPVIFSRVPLPLGSFLAARVAAAAKDSATSSWCVVGSFPVPS